MNIAAEASLARIPAGAVTLEGVLEMRANACGVVVFSHGSGSGRNSPRNQFVAAQLRDAGFGTLLLDLLTAAEDRNHEMRFDIDLLTERLGHAMTYLRNHGQTRDLPLGLFGASTGAASALRVAAGMPQAVRAVVSRGGRPDLAGKGVLARVKAPTLLIVGAEDFGVIMLNHGVRDSMTHCLLEIALVPGATHLFEEPGTLEAAARLAASWFARYLR